MDITGSRYSFQKLNRNNWYTWKRDMTAMLLLEGLYAPIEAIEEASPEAAVSAAGVALTDNGSEERLAYARIWLAVDTDLQSLIVAYKTGSLAWLTFKNYFERTNPASQMILRAKFEGLVMDTQEDVTAWAARVQAVALEAAAAGLTFSETEKVHRLLTGLTPAFQQIRRTIMTIAQSTIGNNAATWAGALRALLEEEQNDRLSDMRQAQVTALQLRLAPRNLASRISAPSPATTSPETTGQTNKPRNNPAHRHENCGHCAFIGHTADECRKRKNGDPPASAAQLKKAERRSAALKERAKTGNSPASHMAGPNFSGAVFAGFSEQEGTVSLIDSGATHHVFKSRDLFSEMQEQTEKIQTSDASTTMQALGKGTINLQLPDGNILKLPEALYVPTSFANLISMGCLLKTGHHVSFDTNKTMHIKDASGAVVLQTPFNGMLWEVKTEPSVIALASQKSNSQSWLEAHARLGHCSMEAVRKTAGAVDGFTLEGPLQKIVCEGCQLGKGHRDPFPTSTNPKDTVPLRTIHCDLFGPITPTFNNVRWGAVFKCEATGYILTCIINSKADVVTALQQVINFAKQQNHEVKVLQSDGETSLKSHISDALFAKHGIKHIESIPYTPQQNGAAERTVRTVTEGANALIHAVGADRRLWADAALTATYLHNRTCRPGKTKTPYELVTGTRPDLSHLQVFGSKAYTHIPKQRREGKFSPHRSLQIFVGYPSIYKAYRFFNPVTRTYSVARDVTWIQDNHGSIKPQAAEDDQDYVHVPPFIHRPTLPAAAEQLSEVVPEDLPRPLQEVLPVPPLPPNQDNIPKDLRFDAPGRATAIPAPNYAGRNLRPRHQIHFTMPTLTSVMTFHASSDVPNTYKAAVDSDSSDLWKAACEEEISSLLSNKTFTEVDLPKGRQAIDTKWVFAKKYKTDGSIERYKARVVARGFRQLEGIDYFDTFSPVASYPTIRTLLSIAASKGWDIKQVDVKTAFLNATLEEEIYVKPPDGYSSNGKKVWKLWKAIYGLKQSGRAWWKLLNSALEKFGLLPTSADSCLWVHPTLDLVIATVVDDMAVAGAADEVERFISYLEKTFPIKRLGDIAVFVGLEITRNLATRTLTVQQTRYARAILARFNMQDCNPVSIPVPVGATFHRSDDPSASADKALYQSMIGSIMFLTIASRPDLAYASGLFSRYSSNPSSDHLNGLRRVLRYIAGTTELGLTLGGHLSPALQEFHGHSDSAFADDYSSGRSTAGYLYTLGAGAISWSSRLQSITCLSTCEAEYVAMTKASKEGIWLVDLLAAFSIDAKPFKLHCDNRGAIELAKNAYARGRTRHINVRFHFIRDLVDDKTVTLIPVPTTLQLADSLTKALAVTAFQSFVASSGLSFPNER